MSRPRAEDVFPGRTMKLEARRTGLLVIDAQNWVMDEKSRQPRPQFYIRLSKEQQFGMIRLWPAKNARIVEKLMIEPVSKMIFEEQQKVETFRQQVGEGLYKIWPVQPLEPGEYALVEFTPAEESGVNIQVWDFGVGAPGAAPPPDKRPEKPAPKPDAQKSPAKKK